MIAEVEKFGKDGKVVDSDEEEVEDIEPVLTPQRKMPFKQLFHINTWWRKWSLISARCFDVQEIKRLLSKL